MKILLIKISLLIFISGLVFAGCSNDSGDNQGEIRVIRDLNDPNSQLNKELTQIEMADKQIEMEKEIESLKQELDQIKQSLKNNPKKRAAPITKPDPKKRPLPTKPKKQDAIIGPTQDRTPDRAIY